MLYIIGQFLQLKNNRLVGDCRGPIAADLRILLMDSLFVYFAIIVKRAYQVPWWRALIAAPICTFALALEHMAYWGMQFAVVILLSRHAVWRCQGRGRRGLKSLGFKFANALSKILKQDQSHFVVGSLTDHQTPEPRIVQRIHTVKTVRGV